MALEHPTLGARLAVHADRRPVELRNRDIPWRAVLELQVYGGTGPVPMTNGSVLPWQSRTSTLDDAEERFVESLPALGEVRGDPGYRLRYGGSTSPWLYLPAQPDGSTYNLADLLETPNVAPPPVSALPDIYAQLAALQQQIDDLIANGGGQPAPGPVYPGTSTYPSSSLYPMGA